MLKMKVSTVFMTERKASVPLLTMDLVDVFDSSVKGFASTGPDGGVGILVVPIRGEGFVFSDLGVSSAPAENNTAPSMWVPTSPRFLFLRLGNR